MYKRQVLSTRNNGLPTKLHPSYDIFNYAVVKAVIDGETYFLDATDKFLSFGEVPEKCLNGDVRVLDFKKGSYWEAIKPRFKTSSRSQFHVELNTENEFRGMLVTSAQGYYALNKRRDLKNKTKDERLDDFETEFADVEIHDFEILGLDTNETSLKSKLDFVLDIDEINGLLTINPFMFDQIKENPFKLNERIYPVDFGYPRSNMLLFNLKIPEGYVIKKMPESVGFSLPNEGGKYVLRVNHTDTSVSIMMKHRITKKIYSSEEYHYLKEFYNKAIKSQENLIVLQKLN